MAEIKTKPTSQDPLKFIKTIEPKQKRKDSFTLLELFQKVTGEKAIMWVQVLLDLECIIISQKEAARKVIGH